MKSAQPFGAAPGDDELGEAYSAIYAHAEKRSDELRRAIMEGEMRTTALASVIANMVRSGEDATEAEQRLMAEMDRLMDLRLDQGALNFLMGAHADTGT